jgi:hypothetical protein
MSSPSLEAVPGAEDRVGGWGLLICEDSVCGSFKRGRWVDGGEGSEVVKGDNAGDACIVS